MLQQQRPEKPRRGGLRELAFPSCEYLDRKMEDHRLLFAALQACCAIFGCLMWLWDYATDPVGAQNTVLLRLSHLVLLVNVYHALSRTDRHRHVLLTFVSGLWAVAVFVLILNRLQGGYAVGVGGFMFFMIMVLTLFQGFSWRFLVLMSVAAAALPQLMALLGLAPGFPHFQYSVLIWPACGIVNICLVAFELNYLHRYHSERMLEFESNHDALTGAWNRRFFMPYVQKELLESRRQDIAPALLIIDIDNFKAVNDAHGHPTGDLVICKLTEIATQGLNRTSDVFARLGGEEFSVLLPNTPTEGAVAIAERLRTAFANTTMTSEAGVEFRCTVSIGVAKGYGKARGTERESDLISRADLALYQAKNSGRNKVCVYAEDG